MYISAHCRPEKVIIDHHADAQNLHFPPESTFFFESVEIWQRLELIANLTTLVNFSQTEYAINCQVHI